MNQKTPLPNSAVKCAELSVSLAMMLGALFKRFR